MNSTAAQPFPSPHRLIHGNPFGFVRRPFPVRTRLLLLVGGALLLLVLLSGCDATPGGTPTGLCRTAGQCTPPLGAIGNPSQGVDWWKQWLYDGVGGILAQIATSITAVGVSIFWTILQTWGSPDFAAGTLNGSSSGPAHLIVTADGIEHTLAQGAYGLIPAILMWRTLISYFLGPMMTKRGENFIAYTIRIIVTAIGILYLPNIVTFIFAASDNLFEAILGNVDTLNLLSTATVGTITRLTTNFGGNPGLSIACLLIAVVFAFVWIVFGLLWFMRLILISLVFCLGPLAIISGTTEEFSMWWDKWRGHMMALFAAPFPAAVVLRFGVDIAAPGGPQTITSYNDIGPALLQAIEVIIILGIGTKLMLDIAGPVGTSVLSYAQKALGTAITFAAVATGGAIGAGGALGTVTTTTTQSSSQHRGMHAGYSTSGSNRSDQTGMGYANARGGPPALPGGGGSSVAAPANFTPLTQTMRGLNSTMQTLAYPRTTGNGGYAYTGSGESGSAPHSSTQHGYAPGGSAQGGYTQNEATHSGFVHAYDNRNSSTTTTTTMTAGGESGSGQTRGGNSEHGGGLSAERLLLLALRATPHVSPYSSTWNAYGSGKVHTLGSNQSI